MSLALLFLAGLVMDVVWTWLVQAIETKKPCRAGALQGFFTLLAIGCTWFVVEDRSFAGALAYAAGGGVGTWFAVTRSRR